MPRPTLDFLMITLTSSPMVLMSTRDRASPVFNILLMRNLMVAEEQVGPHGVAEPRLEPEGPFPRTVVHHSSTVPFIQQTQGKSQQDADEDQNKPRHRYCLCLQRKHTFQVE